MGEIDLKSLPYFEDVLIETKTRRSDWLVGSTEMANYLDFDVKTVGPRLSSGQFYAEARKAITMIPTNTGYSWILLKKDADKYKRHQEPAKVEQNGHAAPAQAAQTVVLKEGSPLLSEKDAQAITRSLFDLHNINRQLHSDLVGLASAVDANTKAVRDHQADLKRIFEGGEKK